MSDLNLKWWQARMLKEQIDAAEEALVLGYEGKFTMDNGCAVEWDNFNVGLEIPKDEDDRVQKAGEQISKLIEQKWKQLTKEEKAIFLKELKGD